MALENYLEQTKLEIANITFTNVKDNLSANQRVALKTLKSNSEVNLKKANKGSTTVVMDTTQKIEEGLEQVSDKRFYKPLVEPIVSQTAAKAKLSSTHCSLTDILTKWHTSGLIQAKTHRKYQNSTRWPKYINLLQLADLLFLVVVAQQNEFEVLIVDSLLQPIAKKQESYVKDTTHFINLIENTALPHNAILVSLDVCSLYTNIPQEE